MSTNKKNVQSDPKKAISGYSGTSLFGYNEFQFYL